MHALEMEEAENLVSNGSHGSKKGKKPSTPELILVVAQEPQHRNKIAVAVMGIIILLVIILAKPQKIEEPGSHHNQTTNVEDVVIVESGMGEVVTVDEPGSAPTPAANPVPESTTTSDTEKKPRPENPRGYSKLSKIPPDPIHPPVTEEVQKALADRWGKWKFWDGEEPGRPSDVCIIKCLKKFEKKWILMFQGFRLIIVCIPFMFLWVFLQDYCAAFPNRDIPGSKFPDNAWQTDAVYVNHYLDAADKLIDRAKEAIFTEYGRGKPPKGQPPLPPEELGRRRHMFHWETLDLSTATDAPVQFQRRGSRGIGGWTTKRSHQGLIRRLLHAMLTSDTFTVVLGGHSAAAGQG
jgi:hypothetical protein